MRVASLQLKASIFRNIEHPLAPHLKEQDHYTGVMACEHLVLGQVNLCSYDITGNGRL